MKQETTAQLRYLRMSPRKARLLVDMVRGLHATDAIVQLQFSKKVAAGPVVKLIRSAIANAKQNHQMNEETLVISKAFVDGGPMQYRWMPKAFGRAAPIRKRTAHITITLTGEAGEQKKDETVAVPVEPIEKKALTKKKATKKKE